MSIVLTDDSNYTAIASSIRSKLGVSTTYFPSEMSGAIDSIPTGSGYNITVTTSHCTAASTNPTSIGEGNIAELIFTPDAGYELAPPTITGASLRKRSGDRIEIENPTGNVTINIEAVQPDYFWVENVGTNDAYFSAKDGFMYSTDKLNWTTSTPSFPAGAKVYIKGNIGKVTNYGQTPVPGGASYKIAIGGNVFTLLNYSGILTDYDWACRQMFFSTNSIVDASQLYINKVGVNTCDNMFYSCTKLVSPPQLTATTLASHCYDSMFNGCTSLTTTPTFLATTLANNCCQDMFYGCTSLTTVQLPATTLAPHCYYNMFHGCTSLTTAPALPATTLANNCYATMFNGCTSLTTAPSLPTTTLAKGCYANMFDGCTSLTTPPSLPATTLAPHCYYYMFSGCTSLTTAPALPATTLAIECYWSMFKGCTSLTTAPSLPATTLTEYCYAAMFDGCTSLTTPPSLPATTLATYCYYYMFSGCTSLKVYSESGEGHDKAWNIPDNGVFTGSKNIQSNMFKDVETDNVSSEFPGTIGQQFTYYTQNQPV